jgi:hypothetical protein
MPSDDLSAGQIAILGRHDGEAGEGNFRREAALSAVLSRGLQGSIHVSVATASPPRFSHYQSEGL